MNRRDFLQLLAASAATAPLVVTGRAAAKPGRPNIILILADDMGFSDLGCYGSEIATPNLDRLARGGVRFAQFYNTARCCPTRSSLLTGLYAHQTGVGHMTGDYGLAAYRGDLNRRCVTIAEALRPEGYHTLMAGKWHVTPARPESRHNWPLQRGFEHFFGTIEGGGSYFDPVTLTRDNTPIQAEGESFYYTDAIGDAACALIADYARRPEPYFLYVAFTAPHWPLHARSAEIAKYQDRYRDGWDALRAERHLRMIRMGMVSRRWPLTPRDPGVPGWQDAPDKEWQAHRMAVYAAQIDRLDQQIGRMLAQLGKTRTEDNTLILFLSDNGGCAEELAVVSRGVPPLYIPLRTRDGRPVRRGNTPQVMPGAEDTYASYGMGWANASNTPFRLYKHWVHEGGIATPLIARWPAVIRKRGAITGQPGHIIDIMATCLAAARASYPSEFAGHPILPLEGKSLLPILRGEKREGHEAICWEHEGNRAIRRGQWKLVSRHPDNWELYDLEADRTEMNDMAAGHPHLVRELSADYERWAKRCGVEPWPVVKGAR